MAIPDLPNAEAIVNGVSCFSQAALGRALVNHYANIIVQR